MLTIDPCRSIPAGIGAPLPVPPSARASALPLLRAAAGDDGDTSSSASSSKKRRRKVPLPAELLEEQAQQAQTVSPSAPTPEPVRVKSREEELAERLKQDIARFKAVEKAGTDDSQAATEATAFEKAASAFEKMLVADFFVVLAFLGWFLTGVVFKSVLNDRSVLDGFNAIWTPVIQPALGMYVRDKWPWACDLIDWCRRVYESTNPSH